MKKKNSFAKKIVDFWNSYNKNQKRMIIFCVILAFSISMTLLTIMNYINFQNDHILKIDCYSMMNEQYRQGLAFNEDGIIKLAIIYFPIIKWFFIAILISWVLHGVQLRLLA